MAPAREEYTRYTVHVLIFMLLHTISGVLLIIIFLGNGINFVSAPSCSRVGIYIDTRTSSLRIKLRNWAPLLLGLAYTYNTRYVLRPFCLCM